MRWETHQLELIIVYDKFLLSSCTPPLTYKTGPNVKACGTGVVPTKDTPTLKKTAPSHCSCSSLDFIRVPVKLPSRILRLLPKDSLFTVGARDEGSTLRSVRWRSLYWSFGSDQSFRLLARW
ncbi:hypothetical protein FNV43_RR14688 [Rhamnella rubrinervis]|uniref:Uncharacterized protein n=1 Tax=Rhamnella rubrinervis TaxID=2594499 RepID=A0A8K0MGL3_9ROSA|nr:hypothetical protein FNV43_RR14688 [Rhamnella rubrinervis]